MSEMSLTAQITSDVPQGPFLGTILFLIYVTGYPEGPASFLNIFADDSKIIREARSVQGWSILQRDLVNL